VLTETLVVLQRQMRTLLRNPVWVAFGLIQPVLYLALFGPLLTNVSGGGLSGPSAWKVFVPGLLLQLAIFGAGFAGFGIIQELREGVIERQRVTPAHRLSLILGRTLSNVVTIGVQAALLTLVAIPFGLRMSWTGAALAVVLVALLSLGMAAASYSMGLVLRDEDAFAPVVQGVTLPLMLLSGVLLPMALAPTWLRRVSQANPLSYVVDGTRAMFRGDILSADVLKALVATVVVSVALAWWATRRFQRDSA
jgi:ABC-2 type transport system permease protein